MVLERYEGQWQKVNMRGQREDIQRNRIRTNGADFPRGGSAVVL